MPACDGALCLLIASPFLRSRTYYIRVKEQPYFRGGKLARQQKKPSRHFISVTTTYKFCAIQTRLSTILSGVFTIFSFFSLPILCALPILPAPACLRQGSRHVVGRDPDIYVLIKHFGNILYKFCNILQRLAAFCISFATFSNIWQRFDIVLHLIATLPPNYGLVLPTARILFYSYASGELTLRFLVAASDSPAQSKKAFFCLKNGPYFGIIPNVFR